MKVLIRIFFSWLPLGIAVTGLCIGLYAVGQQNYRQNANDPQIQLAEDGAAALGRGAAPADIVPRGQSIDIAKSLASFVAVYDEQGLPLESTGVLDGAPPKPSKDLFTNWKFWSHGHTWQPAPDVRIALVIVHVPSGGYVAAGRNMREVEGRIMSLGAKVFAGWLLLLCATFLAKAFARFFS